MKIILVTSQKFGSSSCQLRELIKSDINVSAVILSKNILINKKRFILKKIKKTLNIGLLGALCGFLIRKWYTTDSIRILNEKSIEILCNNYNINFYSVKNINSDHTVKILKKYSCDIGLSVGNGYISSKIFNVPEQGFINVHHELLPEYQNAQSIIWQIFNKSRHSGFTIHKIDKNIDTGDILYRKEVPINFYSKLSKTVSYNYVTLWRKSSKAVIKIIKNFSYYDSNLIKQNNCSKYTTPSFFQLIKIYLNHNSLFKSYKKDN